MIRLPQFNRSGVKLSNKSSNVLNYLDYRIWLNISSSNDMCILPNRFCYKADFIDFNLMLEGMGIMRKILSPAMNGYAKMRKSGFSSEIDTIQVAKDLDLQLMKNPTWTPGKRSMSVKDHMDVIQRLKEKEIAFQEVAATIDKV
jgi:hypothetical protein